MNVENEEFNTWDKVKQNAESFAGMAQNELSGNGYRKLMDVLEPDGGRRSYVAFRTIVNNEGDDVYLEWKEAEDGHGRIPRITGIGMTDWNLATGLVSCTFGTGSSMVKPAGMTPFMEILERILQDYDEMLANQISLPFRLVRPTIYFCATGSFADTPEKDVWTMRGYRTLTVEDDKCYFLEGQADAEESAALREIAKAESKSDINRSRATFRLGKIDRLLEIHRQQSGVEQAVPNKSRKRQLK
ncbi:hypothetical protein HDU86_001715 [Geranomyces michiganensis]|nr:hypothetical protein HDU86_001715 [Geranomyces michiganensis]